MNTISIRTCVAIFYLSTISVAAHNPASEWKMEEHEGYRIHYQVAEPEEISTYRNLIQAGVEAVETFMQSEFLSPFQVYIHPNCLSIDQTWQQDWDYPWFNSETEKTSRLITHELFHVYHGQRNASPNFSDLCGLDWFAEGFATYASGQCDTERMGEVIKAIKNGKAPENLDDFWMGSLRYGLSGSMVMYIDQTYGREKLSKLLVFNQKTEVLESLGTTEEKLLEDWKVFLRDYDY